MVGTCLDPEFVIIGDLFPANGMPGCILYIWNFTEMKLPFGILVNLQATNNFFLSRIVLVLSNIIFYRDISEMTFSDTEVVVVVIIIVFFVFFFFSANQN